MDQKAGAAKWYTTYLELLLGIRRLVALIPLPLSGWSCGRLLHRGFDLGSDQLAQVTRAVSIPRRGGCADVAGSCAGCGGGLNLFGLPQCLAGQRRVDERPDAAGNVTQVLRV